jgi:hypothetical protein
MSLSDLRKELKDLRKKAMPTPVSRMKKADCAAELEKLRGKREETPPVASVGGEKKPKKMVGSVADVKEAKAKEFPQKPVESSVAKKGKKATVVGGGGAEGVSAKMSKKDMLKKMIEELSDSE